jgi:hypothetical protein
MTKKNGKRVVAVRTRTTRANSWMPKEVFVQLDRDLFPCGWSSEPDAKGYSPLQLHQRLDEITKLWHHEYGKSWRVGIR